jgi:hypothetical protein
MAFTTFSSISSHFLILDNISFFDPSINLCPWHEVCVQKYSGFKSVVFLLLFFTPLLWSGLQNNVSAFFIKLPSLCIRLKLKHD